MSRTATRSLRDSDSFSFQGPSRRLYPVYDSRLTTVNIDEESKYKAIVKYLYARLVGNQWLPPPTDPSFNDCHGLLVRRARGTYITEPEQISPVLLGAVQKLNVEVAFTMSTETTRTVLSSIQPTSTEVFMPGGNRLQVMPSLSEIARSSSSSVKKFQYAALVREENLLLVWQDELDDLLAHAASVESRLLALIFGPTHSHLVFQTPPSATTHSLVHSMVASPAASTCDFPVEFKEPAEAVHNNESREADVELAKSPESLDRPLAMISSIFVGMGMFMLVTLLFGLGVSKIVNEVLRDGYMVRIALLATLPLYMCVSLFFATVVFGCLFEAFGPISNLKSNTRFHSAIHPDLAYAYSQGFHPPRITIQMPVYTESLNGVIVPTIKSLKAAIAHYESHGGSATIFVNDDGFAYMTEEQQQERKNFYHDNNIAWVARPKNNSECGYVRKGKFKKASNMNFALNLSNKVEDEMFRLLGDALEKSDMIDAVEEEAYYHQAFSNVLESDSRAWAGGDIRVGEYILIVDSDTRVPVDCLLYGAAEMYLSPEVAIVQHSTGVMQVSWDYFENGITFFTNLVYYAIRFATGSGEVAPFVGHNAFLRWKAIQSVGRQDDGYVAYWSESHVSEDFDIALRLQMNGHIVRLASYHNNEFKEGVSLTVYDELQRWKKYAYGCNELVFNPLHTWLWKGPFSKLFLTFLWSSLPLSSKITIFGYVTSYYALASGFPIAIMNYFLVGWFNGDLDHYYIDSWKVFLTVIVVFALVGNISLAVLRYRLSEKSLWGALFENFKWTPMMMVFFGGLPFHLNVAIFSHFFSIDVSWGATAKEKVQSNFFKEVPKIVKRFKWLYAFIIPLIGGMIYLGCFAPHAWRITDVIAVVPLAVPLAEHALFPLLLNPSLMVFNY